MAYPKHHVLGVRIRIPKKQFTKVRQELLALVRPARGEDAAAVAKRVKAMSGRLGLQVSPASDKTPNTFHMKIHPRAPRPSKSWAQRKWGPQQKQQNLLTPAPPSVIEEPAQKAVKESSQAASGGYASPLAIRSAASVLISSHGAQRSAPHPSSPPNPAIGGKRLAEHRHAHQNPALRDITGQLANKAVTINSDGTLAAPWHFKARAQVGRGTFGNVFGGILMPSGQHVAVKVMSRDPVRVDQDVFLHKEIEALVAVAHPCIVRLIGHHFTTFDVQLYFQRHEMTLRQYLEQGPSEAQAMLITTCVLKGLAHMHATNYVHRDIKAENILVDSKPLAAVIADLGAASFGEASLDVATTLLVRAPELMLGRPFRKACDMWSLGCVVAQIEQKHFLDFWLPKEGQDRATEFVFMWSLAQRLCPKAAPRRRLWHCAGDKQTGLGRGICRVGRPEPGVFGKRFAQPAFQNFMGELLDFRAEGRDTAENLLRHPWLQDLAQSACYMKNLMSWMGIRSTLIEMPAVA